MKKDWKLFVTPQSSPQGQFLDGSPSYVTNDQALVKNLGINLKVVFAGTEAAQLTEIETDYKAKKPVLFYWYTPQYQNAIYKFSQVALPPFTAKCAKLKPADINCSYPPYPLYKVMDKNLAQTAPTVANFIKRFSWTSDEQNRSPTTWLSSRCSNTAAAEAFVKAPPGAGQLLAEQEDPVHQAPGSGPGNVSFAGGAHGLVRAPHRARSHV